jgi:hypothetical protein
VRRLDGVTARSGVRCHYTSRLTLRAGIACPALSSLAYLGLTVMAAVGAAMGARERGFDAKMSRGIHVFHLQ